MKDKGSRTVSSIAWYVIIVEKKGLGKPPPDILEG